MTDMMNNTQVSDPTIPVGGGTTGYQASPGASGPGANMTVAHSTLLTIGLAAGGLVALGVVFRKGQKLPPLRVDAVNAVNVYLSWLLIHGTVKVLAYRFHGHPLAQTALLIG